MKSTEWETPPELFDALWKEFDGFDLDPCCTPGQYTAKRVLENSGTICVPLDSPEVQTTRVLKDGLSWDWHGKVYMNPPYGSKNISAWLDKARKELCAKNVELVVALLPATTDVKWWHKHLVRYIHLPLYSPEGYDIGMGLVAPYFEELRFLPGRLSFVGAPGPARLSSVLVVLRNA